MCMSVSRGGETDISPPWKLGRRSKNSNKPEISRLIPIYLFNSCNDSLFADKTLTLHMSQINCSV